jgi:adsorption protein B
MEGLWTLLFNAREELLLFSGFWILVGGLDDVIIDLIWGMRALWRWLTRYRRKPPMRADALPPPAQPGTIAVFIPAWREAAVIGQMLQRCRSSWQDSGVDYRIYVGCYSNDPETIAAATNAVSGDPHVQIVQCDQPGPTTKADCLNRLWRQLTQDELVSGHKVKAVALHDSEDAVHPLELRIFDYLIERGVAVQLPVIPIQVPGSAWISGHYCDEFAEAHGKSLVVREALGAAVPLAGVGCAIERNRLGRIAIARGGNPFDAESLTEDYELGLDLGADGGKEIFARMLDADGQLVGTRACFPDHFNAASRQKARWMTGIALAGWDRMGWQGGIIESWMRMRDRKALFAAIVLTTAYMCIILSIIIAFAQRGGYFDPPSISPLVQAILVSTLALLFWRIVVRTGFVWLMHGAKQAALSIPRSLVANFVMIVAASKAFATYARHLLGARLDWDKTAHAHFPDDAGKHG